jgi:phosphoribosylanthranilate isomerase
MKTVKVKICGLTRPEDVAASADAGADMVGFLFAASPRQVDIRTASGLAEQAPGHLRLVGVFLDQPPELVDDVLARVPLDLLQFHGTESNAFCASFGRPFIKAVAMGGHLAPDDMAERYPDAEALLYDSHAPGAAGGRGRSFDWSLLPVGSRRFWLAGGLTPDNVREAVRRCRPRAVDVSSGVEDSPGRKNHELIRRFVLEAKSAGR